MSSLLTLVANFFPLSLLSVEYCGSLCSPSVSKSPYLLTVGEDLLPGISVIWTGQSLDQVAFTVATTGTGHRSSLLFPCVWVICLGSDRMITVFVFRHDLCLCHFRSLSIGILEHVRLV